jgi:hypothetical protein
MANFALWNNFILFIVLILPHSIQAYISSDKNLFSLTENNEPGIDSGCLLYKEHYEWLVSKKNKSKVVFE